MRCRSNRASRTPSRSYLQICATVVAIAVLLNSRGLSPTPTPALRIMAGRFKSVCESYGNRVRHVCLAYGQHPFELCDASIPEGISSLNVTREVRRSSEVPDDVNLTKSNASINSTFSLKRHTCLQESRPGAVRSRRTSFPLPSRRPMCDALPSDLILVIGEHLRCAVARFQPTRLPGMGRDVGTLA